MRTAARIAPAAPWRTNRCVTGSGRPDRMSTCALSFPCDPPRIPPLSPAASIQADTTIPPVVSQTSRCEPVANACNSCLCNLVWLIMTPLERLHRFPCRRIPRSVPRVYWFRATRTHHPRYPEYSAAGVLCNKKNLCGAQRPTLARATVGVAPSVASGVNVDEHRFFRR